MKIIFVDFDGVLNSGAWARERTRQIAHKTPPFTAEDEASWILEPACMALLNQAVDRTGAKVVVSSSWRGADDEGRQHCLDMLRAGGLEGEVVGQCPHGRIDLDLAGVGATVRSAEIKSWLADHPEVEAFVILDDEHIGWTGPEFVQTRGRYGIEQEHVDRIVRLLDAG